MKYELTDITKTLDDGTVVHRIRALRNVGAIAKAGDFGGWIEKEANLFQEGSCWVADGAVVCGNAIVWDDAIVCERALVHENAQVIYNAHVRGDAVVEGNAIISLNGVVDEYATVCGLAVVASHTLIRGNALVCAGKFDGTITIGGNATILEEEEWCHFANLKHANGKMFSLTAYLNDEREIEIYGNELHTTFASTLAEEIADAMKEYGSESNYVQLLCTLLPIIRMQLLT